MGAFALTPVFSSTAWVLPVAAVVAVVLAGGLLLRGAGQGLSQGRATAWPAERLGTLLVPVGQVALVLCVLTALFAPDRAVAGLLPTPGSVGDLVGVLSDGTAEMQEQATPALPLTGLLALTTLFVGLVAVVVDLVTVAGRRGALAGLALLVLVCVPVATVTGAVGLPALVAPAIGFAVLLRADQRRVLGGLHGWTGGTGAALRIGVAALAAALVLGPLVPTLQEGSFATGLGGGAGGATGTALDPAAELRGQLTRGEPIDLLRVDASVEDLGYLRAVALDEYDPVDGWTLSNLDGQRTVAEAESLAPLPPRQLARPVTAEIEVLEHDDRFLPVPTSPLSVQVAGNAEDWRFDVPTGTVFGRDVTTAGQRYRVTANEPRPSAELLSGAPPMAADRPVQERFAALPPLDPAIGELTAQLTSGAPTPYEAVRRIQAYLTDRSNGFVYSLSTAPGTSGDDLVDFLRLKRGYCEQYAGAMAVLVRQAGMPARVAMGYTPGSVQDDGSRLITSDDAHAWVEVYFQAYGWVPFDPTPIAVDRRVQLPWSPRTSAEQDVTPTAPGSAPTAAPPVEVPREDRVPEAAPQAAARPEEATSLRPVLAGVGAVTLAAVLLILPGSLRALQRRRRLAGGDAAQLWDELTASAVDLGMRLHPSWTPRRIAGALTDAATPGAAAAFGELARAEETATFGRPGSSPGDPRLAATLRTARQALVGAQPWPRRLRARVWPVSLVSGVRDTTARWARNAAGRRPGRTTAGG
nr:transglutaminase domain-containing protein [Blastococcus saxobsidens]